MAGYIEDALHTYQHEKPSRPQDFPYVWMAPIYGKRNQMISHPDTISPIDPSEKKWLQQVLGNFLYYDKAVNASMLMALNSLAAVQTCPTHSTPKEVTQFLNYSMIHSHRIQAQ